ncbi:RhtB Putative threonine efflux protein [Rhabdaerophilaceae bacterium]
MFLILGFLVTFLPDAATLLSYSIACFVLFVTPGPDMSFFLAKTMQGGRRAGIAAMSGASFGNLIHSLAAAFGLSALIAASATAFTVVKVVGALYLLWMAYDAIRYGSALNVVNDKSHELSISTTLLQGLGVNLTNPKIILFYLTFLPQFVSAADPFAQSKLLFLGVYFVVFALPLAVMLILVAERFIETMRRNPKLMRAIDYTFAGVFTFFALQVLRTQGR